MRMKKITSILAMILFVSANSSPAFAQKAESSKNSDLELKITPREIQHYKKVSEGYTTAYTDLMEEINRGRVDLARIRSLRAYYSKTKDYTPFSEGIINRMTAFGYIADTSTDQVEINDALVEYREILNKHIANFDVITFALTLARADVRYGDELLLNDIRKELIQDLMGGGFNMGKSPERAHTIATYGEETFILEQYGATVKDSEMFKVGRSFYNVHEIVLPNGDFEQIYMNVTDPIRNVRLQQIVRENEEKIKIPGQ